MDDDSYLLLANLTRIKKPFQQHNKIENDIKLAIKTKYSREKLTDKDLEEIHTQLENLITDYIIEKTITDIINGIESIL
jgi:hypothetical protein